MLKIDNQQTDKATANSILVVGVARNCAQHIREDILSLKQSLVIFVKIQWLIVESDSDDNTVDTLATLSSEIPSFRFISCGKLQDKYLLRTERIAFCRNIYLKEIQENFLYQDVDLIMVADLDGVNNLITTEAISSCFKRNDWDVCTANQKTRYYDIWALRHASWCPNDCWRQRNFFKKYGLINDEAEFAAVYSKMIYIPKSSPWIEVESSFGGLAIYKKHTLVNAKYIGLRQDGSEICEHVPLHRQLKTLGFKIFINPDLINSEFDENSHAFFSNKQNPVKKLCFLVLERIKAFHRTLKLKKQN
jgi:hypothetical protein